ncbi:MAG: hypothetical protein MUC89_18595 [Acetobacteraceae bacterium]|jgi:DNA-binding CsgD family transcriptional regulator|nr:hypothetical protein [Acetobacteraceae bacterium]
MTQAAKAEDAWLPPLALAFYAAAAGTADLEAALDLSRETLAADSSFFYVSRLVDGRRFDQHICGAVTREKLDEYTAVWAKQNPRQTLWAAVPDGHVVNFDDLVPPEAFARTEVWRSFLSQHIPMLHSIGLVVTVGPGLQARFGLGRTGGNGPFPPGTTERLAALSPHLRLAARARMRRIGALAASPLPEAAVDALELAVARYGRDGRFLGANAALHRLAAQEEGFSIGPGGLEPARAEDRAALAAAIRRAHGTSTVALWRRHAPVPYVAAVVAASDGPEQVVVIVSDPAAAALPRTDQLGALFGLTEAQAHLARAVAAGVPLGAFAKAEGTPIETVRSRLKVVLARTGCRRQADLAALLARLSPAE